MKKLFYYFSLLVVLTGCSLKTALFDHYSYQQSTALKVSTLSLMEQASAPYASYEAQVNALMLDMDIFKEYERHKPHNDISYRFLILMQDSNKNLVGGFFKRWKADSKLNKVFIDQAKIQVGGAFDLLIQYELQKDRKSKTLLEQFISNP
ncbi:MAG: lipoprotein [Flavobacterium sp.]